MKKECLIETINSCEDPDMSTEAKEFYYSFFPEYMISENCLKKGFRGDCLISLGWTFGVKNKVGDFDKTQRSYNHLLNKEEIELFYLFRKRYHSKANFIILPRELNIYRGAYRKKDNDNYGFGTCDYPDIFLNIVRSFFKKESLSEREKRYVIPYSGWLLDYGDGEDGWRKYVDKNYLNPFVNSNYEVKDIFAPVSIYKTNMCKEVVGTYHNFDSCLPRCGRNNGVVPIEVAKERVVNFLENSIWIWDERADIIYNKSGIM